MFPQLTILVESETTTLTKQQRYENYTESDSLTLSLH